MTIVGIAHVPGITNLDREDTHPLPRPVEQHPVWCMNARGALAACGDHLGESIDIPATAGEFHVVDDGALFPRIEVAASTQDGVLAVHVALFDPTAASNEWAEVNLQPTVAREFAAALVAGRTTRTAGVNHSSAWITVVAGEPVTVVVIDGERKVLVSARLHAHEVKKVADAIISTADVVEGR